MKNRKSVLLNGDVVEARLRRYLGLDVGGLLVLLLLFRRELLDLFFELVDLVLDLLAVVELLDDLEGYFLKK